MDLQSLFDDRDGRVGRDRGRSLRLQCVHGRAAKLLDPKMLRESLEGQLHLPWAGVQIGARQSWLGDVRQEHERPAGRRVVEPCTTRWRVQVLAGVEAVQDGCLVADDTGAQIHGTRMATLSVQVRLAADVGEASGGMTPKEPLKVQIYLIHDVEGTGFWQQLIKDVDVMHVAVVVVNKSRNNASMIEHRVELHGTLSRAICCPRIDRDAQIDRRGGQRVDRLFQIHAKRLVDVQVPSHGNQSLHKRCLDTPVAHLVRVRDSPAESPSAYLHVVELVALRPKLCLDVPKLLAVGLLREREAEKLLETRDALSLALAAVRGHAAAKRLERPTTRRLFDNQLARVNGVKPRRGASQGYAGAHRSRNRDPEKNHDLYLVNQLVTKNRSITSGRC